MADRKISQNPSIGGFFGNNLLVVVDQSDGVGTTKKQTLSDFFSAIETDVEITGEFHLNGTSHFYSNAFFSQASFSGDVQIQSLATSNGIIFSNTFTPGANTGIGIPTGKVFFDSNYLYIKVANNTVKRVALSNF